MNRFISVFLLIIGLLVAQGRASCTCSNGLTIGADININLSLCNRFSASAIVIKGFILSSANVTGGVINVAVYITECLKGNLQVGTIVHIKVNATGCGLSLAVNLLVNVGYLLGLDIDVNGIISLSPCGLYIRLDDLTKVDLGNLGLLCGHGPSLNLLCGSTTCSGLEVCVPGVVDVCVCPNINICLPNLLAPVCGTDGNSYNNLCLLNIASCNAVKGGGVKIDLLAPVACNAGLLAGLNRCLGNVLGGLGLRK